MFVPSDDGVGLSRLRFVAGAASIIPRSFGRGIAFQSPARAFAAGGGVDGFSGNDPADDGTAVAGVDDGGVGLVGVAGGDNIFWHCAESGDFWRDCWAVILKAGHNFLVGFREDGVCF